MSSFKKMKDVTLINNIKNNYCSDSLKELSERHSGLFYATGKKYVLNCCLNFNDLNDNKYWILYNSVMSFDSSKKTKFSTWFSNQIRYFCLNHKNKHQKIIHLENENLDFFALRGTQNESNQQQESLDHIKTLISKIKDENMKNAIYYRYFSNKERILNYSEIADILKVTPQTVLNWHNKFIKFAKKKLTKQLN